MNTEPQIHTAQVRARAASYALAISRADPERNTIMADLDEDELLHTVEALGMLAVGVLRQYTAGDEETALQAMIRREIKTMNSQEGTKDD